MTIKITPAVVDDVLVKALTLPAWSDVEDELVKAFRDTKGSAYEGVREVYGEVLEMLALNLVLARAALAGDDPEEPVVASEPVVLDRLAARELAYRSVGESYGGWTVVVNDYIDKSRWESIHWLVIRNEQGQHFADTYRRGLTEYQDTAPYEYEEAATFAPVAPKYKVVTEWATPKAAK